MNKYLLFPLFISFFMVCISCSQEDVTYVGTTESLQPANKDIENKDTTICYFIVASQQKITDFEVVPYIVKRSRDADWDYLWDPIEGFEYEIGYEYEIEAKFKSYENKELQDVGLGYYELIQVISKEKKESIGIENLVNPVL